MSLINCKRCGTLIPANASKLCPECTEAEGQEYHSVRDYVKQHPSASVMQVSKATGVTVPRIYELVRKGKLVAHSAESDLAVECAVCGGRIVSGRVCNPCKSRLGQKGGSDHSSQMTGRVHLKSRLRRPD